MKFFIALMFNFKEKERKTPTVQFNTLVKDKQVKCSAVLINNKYTYNSIKLTPGKQWMKVKQNKNEKEGMVHILSCVQNYWLIACTHVLLNHFFQSIRIERRV